MIRFSISGSGILVFDRNTGLYVASGRVTIQK